jgi:arylformamidase
MIVYLSHFINEQTPTYRFQNGFNIKKAKSIHNNDIVNESVINTTTHIGTHIDMPFHFYERGQTIKDFPPSFWIFENVLVIELRPKSYVIKDELIENILLVKEIDIELLLIKTHSTEFRNTTQYVEQNYGFHSDVFIILKSKFHKLRAFGFDTISVSSFIDREEGRKAHYAFLNPQNPILLIEDMDLTMINKNTNIRKVIVSPILIENCDGLPCTIFGEIDD